ncbi:MAG TPA: gluconeogenesis factor YvcK family protein, partial [Acidimicrobiales bacterium]|nr:gluconeogenesis factor YvcK family protein [Acidimicrobiales bacterium]
MTAAPSDRFRDGPSVVAVGGGHGQAASLRAIKRYAGNVTAIVSVADDGGSSGRLRELLGIPAPGDVRTCLGALLPDGSAIAKALEHRFAVGELDGHALGNLIITALAEAEGDFVAGVAEACRVLGTVGQVIPATSGAVELVASTRAGQVRGQVAVKEGGGIDRLEVVAVGGPEALEPPPAALKAILESDQIVIGPGSLYTSVLAACVVPAVREAIEEAGRRGAQRVYVANLREQHPETTGYDIAAHVQALTDHGVEPDVVLADTTF